MKAAVSQGSFELFNPDLVSLTNLTAGVAVKAEAGASFRVKSTFLYSSTPSVSSAITTIVWTTPTSPYIIEYACVEFLANLVGTLVSGSSFASLTGSLNIVDNVPTVRSLMTRTLSWSGTVFFLGPSHERTIWSTHTDPGALMNGYHLTSPNSQDDAAGSNNLFHATGGNYLGRPVTVSLLSDPTSWTVNGSVRVTICGKILG